MPPLSRPALRILIGLLALFTTGLPAQQVVPDVSLQAHDGKTTFYLGEPLPLDLVFQNRTGAPFMLNMTDYGDLSEKVEITPATGWFQWQTQSGHDYLSEGKLDDAPVHIPVRLDEGFIFREPGEYRVKVTTARLMRGNTLGGEAAPAITTNEIVLELQTMPADEEATRLEEIRADLAAATDTSAGYALVEAALRRLATLQGDEALAEKIKLLAKGDDGFRDVSREAFASTHNLQKQLTLLEDVWHDPGVTPQFDTLGVLDETRLLLAGHNLQGWQMVEASHPPDAAEKQLAAAHHADMIALLDSMPRRTGESRTFAAYYLIEFGGLTDAERTRAVDYAVEEFPHMDNVSQHMLLQTARPPLRDPRLLATLRLMVAANPSDKDATAALLSIAPAESKEWIVTSVCASKGVVLLDTFKEAHLDRVPQVDKCLAAFLRVAPANPSEEFAWKQRATDAARFATPAILPALREGWKTATQDGAALAILLRNDPAGALALLQRKATAGKLEAMSFFETSNVYAQLQQPFPAEVLAWLRSKLQSGTDKEASRAAYALSIGGDATDAARVEQRLLSLQAQWQGHEPSSDARQAEMELASTLASNNSRLFRDEAQRHLLGQGCMADDCRRYLH